MAQQSRHAAPVLLSGEAEVHPLTRLSLGASDLDGGRREAFIQDLVDRSPAVIPMRDIEPAFDPIISACRELSTPAGYLDNLWLTPRGGIVLGECKLVKNPQARREVVAQALDYARALSTWTFDDLQRAVRQARADPLLTLWSIVEAHTDLDEQEFTDAVERRLRTGRMLVLVIGDGIQEGVEALTSYLQLHAGIHAGLALVDLSVWCLPDGQLVVIPRIPMRTVLIERGIVTVDKRGLATVSAPALPNLLDAQQGQARTSSEIEFYEQLRQRRPGLVGPLRALAETLPSFNVEPTYRKSLVLRWSPGPDDTASAGYVDSYGAYWAGDAVGSAKRLGHPDAGERYLQTLAKAIGGTIRRYEKEHNPALLGPNGKGADVELLLAVKDVWAQAIMALISETSEPLG